MGVGRGVDRPQLRHQLRLLLALEVAGSAVRGGRALPAVAARRRRRHPARGKGRKGIHKETPDSECPYLSEATLGIDCIRRPEDADDFGLVDVGDDAPEVKSPRDSAWAGTALPSYTLHSNLAFISSVWMDGVSTEEAPYAYVWAYEPWLCGRISAQLGKPIDSKSRAVFSGEGTFKNPKESNVHQMAPSAITRGADLCRFARLLSIASARQCLGMLYGLHAHILGGQTGRWANLHVLCRSMTWQGVNEYLGTRPGNIRAFLEYFFLKSGDPILRMSFH
eukprot:gene4898-biopygen2768